MHTIILSDPHGNHDALSSVLDHAYTNFFPFEIWCLGDTVGYGPEPEAVWRTLQNEPIPAGGWLAGNHDWGLLGKLRFGGLFDVNGDGLGLGIQNFRQEAWRVLADQQVILKDRASLWQHLLSLPVMSQVRPGLYLTHGNFKPVVERAVTNYLSTPLTAPAQMVTDFQTAATHDAAHVYLQGETAVPQLFAFGHSHVPGLWRWQHNAWQPLALDTPHPLGNLVESPLCANPGSVGFPRNGLGCPSYVLIDWAGQKVLEEPSISFHFTTYDVARTRAKMGNPPYSALLKEAQFLINPRC